MNLFSQAPWLYPGGQLMMPQLPMQPSLARPLFLEHEEHRLQGQRSGGEQPPILNPYVQSPGFHENAELRRKLEMMMEENQKLKDPLDALERLRQEDEPKFQPQIPSTRRLNHLRRLLHLHRRTQVRLRPPRRLLDLHRRTQVKLRPPRRRQTSTAEPRTG